MTRSSSHFRSRCLMGMAFLGAASCLSPQWSLAKDEDVLKGGFTPKPLDGVSVQAVEKYINPNPKELGLGIGILPINPFFFGFQATGNFVHYLNENFAWEIMNVSYVFSIDKQLTVDLADNYHVAPQEIKRLQFLVSTNMLYSFVYGKTVLFKDYIRYFRGSLIFGLGAAGTNFATAPAANLGLRFDFYATETFSWRFDFRNSTTFGADISSYQAFVLGAGIGL